MRFSVNRTELMNALSLASKVSATRSPQPVLQGVKIDVRDDKLVLQATDLDTSVTAIIKPSFIDGEETFVLRPDRLMQSLREVSDVEVTLSSSVSDLILECSGGTFKFRRMGAEDFPRLPEPNMDKAKKIKAGILRKILERTAFCASREKGRYAINGVHTCTKDGNFEMVATDGKRLSLCSAKIDGLEDIDPVIFPVTLIDLVLKELGRLESDDMVYIYTDGSSQGFFSVDNITLSGRLVDGEYPNYSVVIPKQLDKVAVINKDEFLRICRISAIFTDPTKPIVVFSFAPASLGIESSLQELGESKIGIDIQYEGEKVSMGLNPVYLTEFLKIIPSEELKYRFTSAQRAVLIEFDEDELNGKYVLMPMRIRD